MSTFRFRFRFQIAHKGIVTGDNKELEFALPNGHLATLHSCDADKFSDANKFVIVSGGYSSEEDALRYGFRVKDAVLFYGAKFRVGVDVGKDKASGFLSKYVKDKIFEEHGVKMIDDVHGVTAYSEEHPTSCTSISSVGLINAKGADLFSDEVCMILNEKINIDGQVKLAMELMASSFFESSPHARFLSLILAAESILRPDDRLNEVKDLVDELKERTKKSGIADPEKNSILGSLNWLYKDSISQSLRKMAVRHLPDKNYGGMVSEKFIKKCYEARSKLVHKGAVSSEEYNIGTLAANLELYMKDMLTTIVCLSK